MTWTPEDDTSGPRPPKPDPDDPYRGTREDMRRAIRRLDALEWVILALATVLSLGGGAAVAWMLSLGTQLPFRLTWGVISIALLLIPGAMVFGRDAWNRARKPEGEGSSPPAS
jgi:hypothetical protein